MVMDLGEFTNDYGTFALYFDIINTMDESTGETFEYTVDPPTQPSNGTATITILDINGDAIERIPQGTVKPSQISDSTQASATIKLVVSSPSATQVDLSEITITINQYVPEVYAYFDFEVDEQTKTATLIDFDKRLAESTDIVIPASISKNAEEHWIEGGAYTVTAIGNIAFSLSEITSIELPSTLTSIGEYVFDGCRGLESITLPEGLTSIGYYAFNGCSSLTSITLPEGLTSIGDSAFSSCSSLTSITLPEGLTSIGDSAFSSCSSLTSIIFPSSLTSIELFAFNHCTSLTSITLPSSLTSIGGWAFSGCSGLTEVIIDSEYVYNKATSTSACGSLFNNSSITTVKVLSSLDDGTNSYITTNFTKGENEVIDGKSYTVYSKYAVKF